MYRSIRIPHITNGLLIWALSIAAAASPIQANQQLWSDFTPTERISLLASYPDLEIVPVEAVGAIQSVQIVNRSTAGWNGGAMLGSAAAQAAYVDHAFKGTGSNYSAASHLGAALLGAALGSAVDAPAQKKFVLNYGVRTADGQIREVRVETADEIARPVGQCVYLADLAEAAPSLCAANKVQFLRQLSQGSRNDVTRGSSTVACRVRNVGLMTLSAAECEQLDGVVEK